jgi:hypothetical protein
MSCVPVRHDRDWPHIPRARAQPAEVFQRNRETIWARWTYVRNYLHMPVIAKPLKQTDITIAFKIRNTIKAYSIHLQNQQIRQ